MKDLIVILVLIISVWSCKTPAITHTVTETKWRDTVIYVEIPFFIDKIIEVPLPVHDTLRIIETVYVDKEGLADMKLIHREQGIIGADISIEKGKLKGNFYLLDSTIIYNYKDTLSFQDSLRIYDAVRETQVTNTVVLPPEKYIPKVYKWAFWIILIEVILVVLYFLNLFGVLGNLGRIKNIFKKNG